MKVEIIDMELWSVAKVISLTTVESSDWIITLRGGPPASSGRNERLRHTATNPSFQLNRSAFAYAAFEALVVTETRVILPDAVS